MSLIQPPPLEEYDKLEGYYMDKSGELIPVLVCGYNGHGHVWIQWPGETVVSLVPTKRIKLIEIEDDLL